MAFSDRPVALHIVCNDVMLGHEVFALDAPAYGTRDTRYFAYNRRLVINRIFPWVHLFGKVALVGRLVYARKRILDRRLQLLIQTALNSITEDRFALSLPAGMALDCLYHRHALLRLIYLLLRRRVSTRATYVRLEALSKWGRLLVTGFRQLP